MAFRTVPMATRWVAANSASVGIGSPVRQTLRAILWAISSRRRW